MPIWKVNGQIYDATTDTFGLRGFDFEMPETGTEGWVPNLKRNGYELIFAIESYKFQYCFYRNLKINGTLPMYLVDFGDEWFQAEIYYAYNPRDLNDLIKKLQPTIELIGHPKAQKLNYDPGY